MARFWQQQKAQHGTYHTMTSQKSPGFSWDSKCTGSFSHLRLHDLQGTGVFGPLEKHPTTCTKLMSILCNIRTSRLPLFIQTQGEFFNNTQMVTAGLPSTDAMKWPLLRFKWFWMKSDCWNKQKSYITWNNLAGWCGTVHMFGFDNDSERVIRLMCVCLVSCKLMCLHKVFNHMVGC